MCVTQSDTFRYARLRYLIVDGGSLVMEMEVGDDSAGGPSWLGYYKQLLLPIANVTRAVHISPAAPAYIYDAHT